MLWAFALAFLLGFATPSLQRPLFSPYWDVFSFFTTAQSSSSGGNQTTSSNFTGPPANLSQVNQSVSITSALQSNSSFSYLTRIIQTANASSVLNATTNHTVFAPINSAFDQLPTPVKSFFERSSNRSNELLRALIQYHIVPGQLTLQSFQSSSSGDGGASNKTGEAEGQGGASNNTSGGGGGVMVPTQLGNLSVILSQGPNQTLLVNDATVVAYGNASDGVVFAIDKILTPLYFLNMSIYNLPGTGGGGGGNSSSSG
ncbi:hypothetical protein HDU96_001036 [Phlyctochytrium bullatum]|nr:hypothetical protein HDU96_001036 [Phlyctochytrium bullatum]